MKASLAFGWFVVNGSLLWTMSFVSQRLLHQFKEKYPQVAETEIPRVFEGIRHPEQFLYFYRRRAAEVMKNDQQLLQIRRRLIVVTWLAATLPIPSLIVVVMLIRMWN